MSNGICDSVGAIIKDENRRYLTVYRKVKPVGLGFLSAHVVDPFLPNPEWRKTAWRHTPVDSPGEVIRKVVLAETGIRIINIKLVHQQMVEVECRRGYRNHFCRVYEVLNWEGKPQLLIPDKHEFVKFMSIKEMGEYIKRDDTDPAWFKFILRTLEILP